MQRKTVFDSCRRVVAATGTVSARYKSTGPTGTCMHRTVGVADSGSTFSSSTIADDQVPKKSKNQKPRAAAKFVKVDVDRAVAKPCSGYSEVASTSTIRNATAEVAAAATTPAEAHGSIGAQIPQQPLKDGSASKSKIYSQFTKSSTNTIASNRKNKMDERHHQTNITKNQHFVTLGPRLKPPVTNHGARMRRVLPTLNASALFQAQPNNSDTCKELLQVIREESMRKRRQAFVMTGHDVPPQLFQDHLQMADSFLRQENAVECSFNNFHDHLTVDNMIRVGSRDGSNRPSRIPPSLHNSLELYLTVMNRMATHLAQVFLDEHRQVSHWNVEFLRNLAFVPQLLPTNTGEPVSPIVEWVSRTGINAPGHVIITLQGFANPHHRAFQNLNRDQPPRVRQRGHHPPLGVALVFDACFRNTG